MSGKPKVYQGVRVKITVKELLQQRRAKQAVADEALPEESSSSIQFTESFSPSYAAPYGDADLVSSSPGFLQPWPLQNCISCDEIPSDLEQLVDSCLQTELPLEVSLGAAQGNLSCSADGFQPLPTCLNQSLESPDSSNLSSSCEYSPSQLLPPFAQLSYSSSSPQDAKSCAYPSSEGSPYPQHGQYNNATTTCYCTSCGTQHLDAFRAPEYFPYTNMDCKDYTPSVSMADDFFRKDRSWDICYS